MVCWVTWGWGGLGSHFGGKEPQRQGIFLENYCSVVIYHTCMPTSSQELGKTKGASAGACAKDETEVGKLWLGAEDCCTVCDMDTLVVWKPLSRTALWLSSGVSHTFLLYPHSSYWAGRAQDLNPILPGPVHSLLAMSQCCSGPGLPDRGNSVTEPR